MNMSNYPQLPDIFSEPPGFADLELAVCNNSQCTIPPKLSGLFTEPLCLDHVKSPVSNNPQSTTHPQLSGLFAEPLGFDDLEPALPLAGSSGLDHENSLESFKDCMLDAARFAVSQNSQWLHERIGAGPSEEPTVATSKRLEPVITAMRTMSLRRKHILSRQKFLHFDSKQIFTSNGHSLDTESILLEAVFSASLTGLDPSDWMSSKDTITKPLVSAMLNGETALPAESSAALQNRMTAVLYRNQAQRHLTSLSGPRAQRAEYVARAQHCGSVYQDLFTFAEAYAFVKAGRVLEALANYAYKLSRAYFSALMRVIEDENTKPEYKAWSMVLAAEDHVADMCLIANMFSEIEETDGSCCAVINVVLEHSQAHCGNETIHDALNVLMSPYMDYVWDWVLNASSTRDISENFFGSKLGLAITSPECLATWDRDLVSSRQNLDSLACFPNIFGFEQALFILRAGRNRSLLKRIAPWKAVDTFHPPESVYQVRNIEYQKFLQDLDQFANRVIEVHHSRSESAKLLSTENASPENVEMTSTALCEIESSSIHSDFQNGEHHNAFQIPDDGNDCSSAVEENKLSVFRYQEAVEDDSKAESTKVFPHYTQSEWPPPRFLYGQALLEPLKRIDDVVQQDLLQFFINDLDVYGHFKNLRSHVLLGAGDFANVLVEQINLASETTVENERFIKRRISAAMTFYGTTGTDGKSFRDRTHLTRCLQTALNVYSSSSNPLTEFLSLDATCIEGSTKTALWDSNMSLKYATEYPLNLILSDQAMSMYSTFFGFFLRVLRAQRSLRNLFMVSRRNSALRSSLRRARNNVLSERRLRVVLWQFCWQAQHFVNIFGGFAFDQALGASWNNFQKSWASVRSIWDLRDAHMNYLSSSIKRCLLAEKHKSVLSLINGGFDIVVNLDKETSGKCSADSYCSDSELNDLSDLLTSASASLRSRASFLMDILERLIENGSHPHLETLLPQLNFNVYYQVSTRPLTLPNST